MNLRGILAELRHRGVLKVATAYLATAAVALEGFSVLFQSFEAPHWVLRVLSTLVIIGFPVACMMAWGLEFTPQGVHTAPPMAAESPPEPRHTDAVFAGVLAIVFALVTAMVVHQWRLPAAGSAKAVAVGPPSIAVLPFVDMSAEHDQQYLGDGIAEELLNALSSVEGLNVAARTSSFSFAGKNASVKEIGDTLHVRHVLEGSVRRSEEKLRVTAQLIDVESGFHLFSQSYDREVKDVFEIQNEIAREIVTALMPKLGLKKDTNLVKQGTTDLEAYNLRLKAHVALLNPAPGTLEPAVQQLRQAIALDPKYSDAWADLSYAYSYLAIWARDPMQMIVSSAGAAASALAHSPTNATALLTQATISILIHGDVAATADYLERSRAAGVDPSLWAYQKAYLYDGPLGRYDVAIAMLEEAARKDPLAPNIRWAQIEIYLAAGRIAEAVEAAREFQKLGSKAPGGLMLAGLAYIAAGDIGLARESLATLRTVFGDEFPVTQILQFAIYGATNDRQGARTLLEHLLAKNADRGAVNASAFVIGDGYKTLGDYDSAISWWSRAADSHVTFTYSFLPIRNRGHPIIGKDPRFLALLKRMGLEGEAQGK